VHVTSDIGEDQHGLRIGIVHPYWDPVQPASARSASNAFTVISTELAGHLRDEGHHVTIYSHGDCATLEGTLHEEGITYHYTDGRAFRRERRVHNAVAQLQRSGPARLSGSAPYFGTTRFFAGYYRRIARQAAIDGMQVLHVLAFPHAVRILRAKLPHAVIGLHVQNDWLGDLPRRHVEPAIRGSDVVVACSQYVAERIRERLTAPDDRIIVVPNGISPGVIATARARTVRTNRGVVAGRHRTVLYVGRVSPEKGLHRLIEAFTIVANDRDDVRLRIVGPESVPAFEYLIATSNDRVLRALRHMYSPILRRPGGRYRTALDALIPVDLQDRIEFVGPIPNVRLGDEFDRAEMAVFAPVWHEPFGIPIIEALAHGVPLVTSASGGISEMVSDGVDALVVPRDDTAALAAAITRVLDDPALRSSLGAAGPRTAARLRTWDHIARELAATYTRALQSRAATRRADAPDTLG
jgi:glycosyltransferase involved in cell wall biosynthesis